MTPGAPGSLRRRALSALAVATLIGLPGAVAAGQMVDDDGNENASEEEGWGATSFLDESAEDYVQANWERAMDIEPIYAEDVEIDDEDMAPLVGALGVSGIPEVALDAYYNAEDTLAVDDPDCGVPWSLLAAIGRVESNHGRFGGAELLADGYGTKPIRGIPLDGRPGVALIRDTDNGALDDDTVFDRAVGPMQFIPTTWPNVAADGNDDSQKDPDNIFDATIGAGVYLCGGDGDLLFDEDARAAAVKRYNNSDEYVRTVLSLAEMYEDGGAEALPFDDPGFDDFGSDDEFDAESAAAGELGPELPEPAVIQPQPAPPAEVPTLPAPAPVPVSVGWPSGMNELPPAQLPPPIPLPTTTTTAPPTTVPPTTVPAPVDPECPAPAPSTSVPPTTTTTVPAPTTLPPSVEDDPDPVDPDCEPTDPAAAPGTEAGLSTGTGGSPVTGASAGASTPGSNAP